MKRNTILIYSILSILLIKSQAAGDTENIKKTDEIVVTATMGEKKAKYSPGAIEVITARDIEDMNAKNLSDALMDATGLYVTTESGRMMRPSIRGTGNRHTLVLIDGRRISSGFKDIQGIEQIPLDLVKRIEIIRGPSSALYGSDAIGGVINIITKKPPQKTSLGASIEYGQSTYKEGEEVAGSAYFGGTYSKLRILAAGSYKDKNGYDRDNAPPDDGDYIERKSAGGRLSYELSDNHEIIAGFESIDRSFHGLRDLQNLTRDRKADDDRLNYFMEYNGNFSCDTSIMFLANRSEHENEVSVNPQTKPIPQAVGDEANAQRLLDQFEARFSSNIFNKHRITIGGQYLKESREDDSGLDDYIETTSAYAQEEYQITDSLYMAVSARFDNYSDFGSKWTPKVLMQYSVSDNLRLKAGWGKGFRAPGFLELFIPTYMKQGKEIYQPNNDLDPESSASFDFGIEGEYKKFHAGITWFKTEIEDLIEPDFDYSTGSGKKKKDYYIYKNIAKAEMTGLELEWSLGLPAGFGLSGNFFRLETEDKTTGEELEGRPDYKGSLKLDYKYLPFGFRANLRATYTGERYYESGTRDDLTIVDAYASKDITKNLTFFAGSDNIFNSGKDDYEEPTIYYCGMKFNY